MLEISEDNYLTGANETHYWRSVRKILIHLELEVVSGTFRVNSGQSSMHVEYVTSLLFELF